MPEHVHLLLSEPQPDGGQLEGGNIDWLSNPQPYTLADALKSLKQGVAPRLISDASHFW